MATAPFSLGTSCILGLIQNMIQPDDLLNFVELDWFVKSWEEMELSDADLAALQILIMSNPREGDLIQGTNGLRKLRFSPRGWRTGKSGGLRVCYLYFEKYGLVILSLVYKKNELVDVSPAGKKSIRNLIRRIEAQLEKQYGF